jgi:hypothetical protein
MITQNTTDDTLIALEENLLTSDEMTRDTLAKVEEIKSKIDEVAEDNTAQLATLKHELLTVYHTYLTHMRNIAAQSEQLTREDL